MFKLKFHLLLVSIIPFIAIHLSFILSVQNEYLALCNPYIDGCYSISRVARQPSSIIIFSGASQIVIFQLISAGASTLVAITSSAVVSSRHLLYGAVVSQYLSHLSIYWKITLSYLYIR